MESFELCALNHATFVRVAKSAVLPIRERQLLNLSPMRSNNTLNHHLSDALTALNHHRLAAEVDCDQLNLTPVVGIDGSGTVNHSQSLFYSKPATRTNLGF